MSNVVCRRDDYRRRGFLCALSLLITVAIPALAQRGDQLERFRLAQSYLQNGEPEEASQLFEDLYAAYPGNDAFFGGLTASYLALKKYDTLAIVIRSQISQFGGTVALYSLLGRALFHANHEREARVAWDSAMAIAHGNEAAVRRVTEDMIAARAYPCALESLHAIAKQKDNPLLYAAERANLYALLSKYREATQEYVLLLRSSAMPLAYIESRLSYFTTIDQGQQAALEVVRTEAQEHSDDVNLQYLLAWLLMERKAYDEAYGGYLDLDDRRSAAGGELIQFASRALGEGALDVALRAFRTVQKRATNEMIQAWALFGAAGTREKLWKSTAPDSTPFARAVADEYDQVAAAFPKSIWADSASLRSASLRTDVLFDFDGAAIRIRTVLANNGRLARSGEPELLLGDLFISQHNLDSATATVTRVLRARGTGPDAVQHARFMLGRLQYYRGAFDSAATLLALCTSPPNAAYATDAISLLLLIQENQDTLAREALKTYSAAELAARHHDLSNAIAGMQEIATRYPSKTIAEYALVAAAGYYSGAGQYGTAQSTYKRLLDQYPESILRDRAQLRIAALLEGPLHDPAAAIRAYELLLQNYPGSIFLEDARLRIRSLRAQL